MSDPTPPGLFTTITTFLARIPFTVIDTTLTFFGWGHQEYPDDIFPPTANEFLETETIVEKSRPICANGSNTEFRQSYVFGRGSHQFYIFVDTMTLFLKADGYMLKEVDLSLPDDAMPYNLTDKSRKHMCYCIERYIRVLAYINWIKCHPRELYRKTLIDNLMYELDELNELYERHDELTRHRFEEFIENQAVHYQKELFKKSISLKVLRTSNEHTLRSDILRSYGNLKLHQIDEIAKIMCKLEDVGWYNTLTTSDRTKEFIEMFTANKRECRDKLLNALRRDHIDVIVSPFTKNMFVKNCDWDTLYKISKLVDELNCDLTVSGGGTFEYTGETILGEYMVYPHVLADDRSQSNTAKYNKNLQIYRECPEKTRNSVKVGVMDSGCSPALYEHLKSKETVKMHPKMFDVSVAGNSTEPGHFERDYKDSYKETHKGTLFEGHGSAVVEIITNCVPKQTQIYVASLGETVVGSKVEAALYLLSKMDVNVINCSLSAGPSSVNIERALRDLQNKGVVVVVSARNRMKPRKKATTTRPKPKDGVHVPHPTTMTYAGAMDTVSDALFSKNTIRIGSHDDDDKISALNAGRCEIDACCRGDNVFLKSVTPSVRYGNSYAAPYATAIIVIGLSFYPQRFIRKDNIGNVLDSVKCECATHKGKELKLKLSDKSLQTNSDTASCVVPME